MHAADLHNHEAHCITDKRAASDVYARCAQWWRLARELHEARRLLERFTEGVSPDQAMLPGMDTL